MSTEPLDESLLAAWWCAEIPRLVEASDRFRWRHKLDAARADIRAGMPVSEALAKHGLPFDPPGKEKARTIFGDPVSLADLGLERKPVSGGYVCPAATVCGRRADYDPDTGREPHCEIAGKPMLLAERPR